MKQKLIYCLLWKVMSELEDVFWIFIFAFAHNLCKFMDVVEF